MPGGLPRRAHHSKACAVPHCVVDIDDFWRIVEQARSDAGVLEGQFDSRAILQALTERLVVLPPDEILDFGQHFHWLVRHPTTWEMCAACLLISGCLSDDTLDYFNRGIVALGRDTFERFTADPDSLADNFVVTEIANGRLKRTVLVAEEIGWAALEAYARLNDGDEAAYWDAQLPVKASDPQRLPAEQPRPGDWDGRFGRPEDLDRMPIRLPRLTALFPAHLTKLSRGRESGETAV